MSAIPESFRGFSIPFSQLKDMNFSTFFYCLLGFWIFPILWNYLNFFSFLKFPAGRIFEYFKPLMTFPIWIYFFQLRIFVGHFSEFRFWNYYWKLLRIFKNFQLKEKYNLNIFAIFFRLISILNAEKFSIEWDRKLPIAKLSQWKRFWILSNMFFKFSSIEIFSSIWSFLGFIWIFKMCWNFLDVLKFREFSILKIFFFRRIVLEF